MRLGNSTAILMADAACAALNVGGSGLLRIYTGSAPSDADASATGTLLAELVFNSTAFAGATDQNPGARAVANSIADDVAANATGTAGYFRAYRANGTTCVFQGSVTATGGGGELQLNSVSLVTGGLVQVTGFNFNQPET